MIRRFSLLDVLLLVLLLAISAPVLKADSSATTQPATTRPTTPGAVISAMVMAANSKDFNLANSYCAKDSQQPEGYWNHMTRDGTIDKVEIHREVMQGEDACRVYTERHFKDKKTSWITFQVKKIDGEWKCTQVL